MKEKDSKKASKKEVNKLLMSELNIDKEEFKKLKKKLRKAEGKPDRGIETWFRLTSKNLYTRLQIVDTKANILITANAIIISVVLGSLYPALEEDPHLIFAVGGMVITNVLSIAFAILATLPQKLQEFEYKNQESSSQNLMTFDGFYNMSNQDYSALVMDLSLIHISEPTRPY